MAGNQNLHAAARAKKDEFYTQMEDIANELKHYKEHFRGKTVLCNCDDPYESNFFKYFALNFNALGLRKLIATCFDGSPVQGNELLFDFGDGTDGSTGKVVEIRVCDTGEVIPEAVRGDIFQPFFTTREVGKGKGLGLAVCRSLVETRQGRIELEKSLPGNTCFRILLPFEKVPA